METLGDITGIILAGGQSRRMGGGDKSLLPLQDLPLISHVLGRFAPQVARVIISANGDPVRFETCGLPVVPDRIEGFLGPLAGINAGLSYVREVYPSSLWAVTVPGDTPFLPEHLVTRLVQGRGNAVMAAASTATGLHPVAGLWPVAMAGALAEALQRGERRVGDFVTSHGAAEVFFEPVRIGGAEIDPFFNINAPDDLETARNLLAQASRS